jgi:hypothetical protein
VAAVTLDVGVEASVLAAKVRTIIRVVRGDLLIGGTKSLNTQTR